MNQFDRLVSSAKHMNHQTWTGPIETSCHHAVDTADAIIFIARSRTCRAAALKDALERLRLARVPIIGGVLNGVDALYMDKV